MDSRLVNNKRSLNLVTQFYGAGDLFVVGMNCFYVIQWKLKVNAKLHRFTSHNSSIQDTTTLNQIFFQIFKIIFNMLILILTSHLFNPIKLRV